MTEIPPDEGIAATEQDRVVQQWDEEPVAVPIVRAVEAVSQRAVDTDTNPDVDEEPLYQTIDPDALEQLVTASRSDVVVSFTYLDTRVTVTATTVTAVANPD